ncbi:hypothetical protein FALBO_2248 [Fusarium albosuccineum]|uniref:ABC transmembrane type-1 domain-containing protein n=1 Tax=Fusarium albosuccineum TaxID=1237068 RepID=A0A8H4LKG4_9HYPO|nr:hypothetical protein FALBO_2248 [Fusarium albosuccineum]
MAGHNRLIRALALLVLGLSIFVAPVSASWANPLEHFYSSYNHGLQEIIHNNCSETYALYLQDRRNAANIRPSLRVFGMRSMTSEMLECILENSPEIIKYKMAAAAIVLGLAPTIIATLGVRPQDTAALSIIGRRHLLAFGVAVGSPALNAYRASEYTSVIDTLREKSHRRPDFIRRLDPIITAISYALAGASIANVGELTYRLGAGSIFTVLVDSEYLALLWAFLGVFIHFMTGVALRMRASSVVKTVEEVAQGSWPVSVARGQMDIMARRSKIFFRVHSESLLFSIMALITTIFTACHVIFGTLVFSSILFVSINDSLSVAARLMASAIICRIIVTYELLVLRESIEEVIDPRVVSDGSAESGLLKGTGTGYLGGATTT